MKSVSCQAKRMHTKQCRHLSMEPNRRDFSLGACEHTECYVGLHTVCSTPVNQLTAGLVTSSYSDTILATDITVSPALVSGRQWMKETAGIERRQNSRVVIEPKLSLRIETRTVSLNVVRTWSMRGRRNSLSSCSTWAQRSRSRRLTR